MASLIKDGQFEKCIRNFGRCSNDLFKALDRFLRTKDHAISLSDQVQDVRAIAAQFL